MKNNSVVYMYVIFNKNIISCVVGAHMRFSSTSISFFSFFFNFLLYYIIYLRSLSLTLVYISLLRI